MKRYQKEIENLKKKLRYTSAGGEKDFEICSMINELESVKVIPVNITIHERILKEKDKCMIRSPDRQ